MRRGEGRVSSASTQAWAIELHQVAPSRFPVQGQGQVPSAKVVKVIHVCVVHDSADPRSRACVQACRRVCGSIQATGHFDTRLLPETGCVGGRDGHGGLVLGGYRGGPCLRAPTDNIIGTPGATVPLPYPSSPQGGRKRSLVAQHAGPLIASCPL
jgi:hypothetical protein